MYEIKLKYERLLLFFFIDQYFLSISPMSFPRTTSDITS